MTLSVELRWEFVRLATQFATPVSSLGRNDYASAIESAQEWRLQIRSTIEPDVLLLMRFGRTLGARESS
jgi:hypothetical protein